MLVSNSSVRAYYDKVVGILSQTDFLIRVPHHFAKLPAQTTVSSVGHAAQPTSVMDQTNTNAHCVKLSP